MHLGDTEFVEKVGKDGGGRGSIGQGVMRTIERNAVVLAEIAEAV